MNEPLYAFIPQKAVEVMREKQALAEAKLCRAEMSLERRTEDAERLQKDVDALNRACVEGQEREKKLADALLKIAVIVEVPRGAMMHKIRKVLEEAGFW